jgi:hypothetical protein
MGGTAADSGQGGAAGSAGASGAAGISGGGAGSAELSLSLVRLLSILLQREPNSDLSDLLNALIDSNALDPALLGRVLARLERSSACAPPATDCASTCKLLVDRCSCATDVICQAALVRMCGALTTTCG